MNYRCVPPELLPGLVVAGDRGTLLRSLDCEGLGVRFAGALGSALGFVGSVGEDCIELSPCMGAPGCIVLPRCIEPVESVGLGMLVVAGSPPTAGNPVAGVELPPCIMLPLCCVLLGLLLPGLVVAGERGTLLRSLDCEGLGVRFAGALGLVLGTVGSELGVDCIELPFCIELPLCIELPVEPPLPGFTVAGERGTLLRSFDCEGLGVRFAGALGLVLGTVGSLGVNCVELPLCVESVVELAGLGMLVVEGSPPVAGTLVELGELAAGAALLG